MYYIVVIGMGFLFCGYYGILSIANKEDKESTNGEPSSHSAVKLYFIHKNKTEPQENNVGCKFKLIFLVQVKNIKLWPCETNEGF